MIVLLSPAKSLDFKTPAPFPEGSQPLFTAEAEVLVKKLRKLSAKKLSEMMDISDELALLNVERFADWKIEHTNTNSKQAMFSFNGEVYSGLNARSFTPEDIDFAQKHLRILSGLYGILRPLDYIHPYRLEMGSAFPVSAKAKNLYAYWNAKVTKEINRETTDIVVNLASVEYFKALDSKKLKKQVINCHFKDEKNGQLKIIQFFAKRARGMMANYIVKNKINTAEDLKGFDSEGYTFAPALSSESDLVFSRPEKV